MSEFAKAYTAIDSNDIASRVPAIVSALKDCKNPDLLFSLGRQEGELLTILPLGKKGVLLSPATIRKKYIQPYYEQLRAVHCIERVNAAPDSKRQLQSYFAMGLADYLYRSAQKGKTESENELSRNFETPVVKPRAVAELASRLLDSSDWKELAIGLAIAIGRRTTEIVYRGEIKPSGGKVGYLLFRGALKLKRSQWEIGDEWRELPTLLSAKKVLDAWERLRSDSAIADYHDRAQKDAASVEDAYDRYKLENERIDSLTNRHCNNCLQDIPSIKLIIPCRRDKNEVTMHDLRAVYGALSVSREAKPTASRNDRETLFKAFVSDSTANYGDYGVEGKVPPVKTAGQQNDVTLKTSALNTLRIDRICERLGESNRVKGLDAILSIVESYLDRTLDCFGSEVESKEKPSLPLIESEETMKDSIESRFAAIESDNAEIKALLTQLLSHHQPFVESTVEPAIRQVPPPTPEPQPNEQIDYTTYMQKQQEASHQWENTPNIELFGWNGRAMRHSGAAYERVRRVLEAVQKYNGMQSKPGERISFNTGLIRGVTNAPSKFVADWIDYHSGQIADLHLLWEIESPDFHNRDKFAGDPVVIILEMLRS